MATKDSFTDTNSRNLGVEGEEELRQRLDRADGVNEIAHQTSRWARKRGTISVVDDGEVYVYRGGLWRNDGEQVLCELLWEAIGEDFTPNTLRYIKNQLRGIGVTKRNDLGCPSETVTAQNGLIDLQGVENRHRNLHPQDHAIWRFPVEYDPEATCPDFNRILEDWVPDPVERAKLQEYVGYALDDSSAKFEKMLLLLGPTDTGKTVFLDVVEALFGEDNVANQSIQYLANQRWGVDKVVGKPVNIRHDLDSRLIKRTSVVKELASGNPMKAERKSGDPYEARPTAKHFFSANRVSERKSPDKTFYNRWLTVMFTEQIPRDDQDSDLAEKLTRPEELSGILNWAIEGYQRLREQGHFTGERSPSETQSLWQKNGGSIDRFISKPVEIVRSDDAKVSKATMYAAYTQFAENHDTTPETQHMLTRKLNSIDGIESSQRRFNGEPKSAFVGVRLRNF